MIDNVRVKIFTKNNGEFFKDRDVEIKNVMDLETGYQAHKQLVKEIAIENNIKYEDVKYIRVYLNREDENHFYYFLEMWTGTEFNGLYL